MDNDSKLRLLYIGKTYIIFHLFLQKRKTMLPLTHTTKNCYL